MISKHWVKKLTEEIKEWVSEGLIDNTQRERIVGRYSERIEYSRLLNTIISLGSILVGLGILLFVASNWDKLARATKIFVIFAVITLFNLLGYYFRYIKSGYRGLTEGFTLIAAFAFGAGIWLIAQIYQIHYNFSAGIMFWIFGILPIAYLCRSWHVLSLSSILGLVWLISYQSYYSQREAFGFFIPLSALVILSYIQKQRFPLFVLIISSAIWLGRFWFLKFIDTYSFLEGNIFVPHLFLTAIYSFFGFILYGVGMWQEKTERFVTFSFLYKILGILFVSGATYFLTFSHHYYKYSHRHYPWQLLMLIAILVILAGLIFSKLSRKAQEKFESIEGKVVSYFFVSVILATVISYLLPRFASVSFNIVLLVISLGFMYIGFIKHNEGIFRLAIIVFFIDALSRYFDIFWKMMPRSLLFIFGGILLIGGAIFTDHKRRLIENKMHTTQ